MERFREVIPGILRGGVPSEEEVRTLENSWDVKRIVSLDLDAAEKIAPICENLGIEQIIIPIENDGLKETLQFLSDNIVDLLSTPTTFIHCVHGMDRTGLAIALYRIKAQGWSLQDALKEALSLDFGKGISNKMRTLYISYLKDAENNSPEQEFSEAAEMLGDIPSDIEGAFQMPSS